MVKLDAGRLNRARLRRGWTWADVAAATGLASRTRTKLANGEPVTITVARRACAALRISLAAALILDDPVSVEAPAELPVGQSAVA